jgi:hypothetical protein
MGLKKGFEITVILTSLFWSNNAKTTGIIIATSPIAERRIMAICLTFCDKMVR